MGYARQDKAFEAGHPISARAVARAVSTTTDRVCGQPPRAAVVTSSTCRYQRDAARFSPTHCRDLQDRSLSPDEGAIALATTVRDAYGEGETDFFEKDRTTTPATSTSAPATTGRGPGRGARRRHHRHRVDDERVRRRPRRPRRPACVRQLRPPLLASNALTKLTVPASKPSTGRTRSNAPSRGQRRAGPLGEAVIGAQRCPFVRLAASSRITRRAIR